MRQHPTLKGAKGGYHCDVKTIINTNEFARMGEVLSGNISGEELERADDLLFDHQASVAWQLKGEQTKRADGGVESYLDLRLSGIAKMICLRCLEVIEIPIDMARQFRLAKDEAHAAKLDAEDEVVDAIVGSVQFEVLDLVEDEVIMALPFAPKHEICSAPTFSTGFEAADAADDNGKEGVNDEDRQRPNPFRVLAQLKKPNP
jgi:uncharacterized protein